MCCARPTQTRCGSLSRACVAQAEQSCAHATEHAMQRTTSTKCKTAREQPGGLRTGTCTNTSWLRDPGIITVLCVCPARGAGQGAKQVANKRPGTCTPCSSPSCIAAHTSTWTSTSSSHSVLLSPKSKGQNKIELRTVQSRKPFSRVRLCVVWRLLPAWSASTQLA